MNNLEIERKFLVRGDFSPFVTHSERIVQGYIASGNGRTVRVRLYGERGYLTIKGPSGPAGLSRFEWEKEIGAEDARALMMLCLPGMIDKTRNLVPCDGHTFEVDVFHGDNEGLIIAEVELRSEDEAFERPAWLGREVTGDRRFYNASLARKPYSQWNEEEKEI